MKILRYFAMTAFACISNFSWATSSSECEAIMHIDWQKSYDMCLPLALENDPAAQYVIGSLFVVNEYKNVTKSYYWLKKASDNGHYLASTDIARAYMSGDYGKVNTTAAIQFYKKAKSQGSQDAELWLQQITHGVVLFGEYLAFSNRERFSAALKSAGAKFISKQEKSLTDTFDSTEMLNGSHRVSVEYFDDGQIACLNYKFPYTVSRLNKVVESLDIRFGEIISQRIDGEMMYKSWTNHADGIRIEINKDDNNHFMLSYKSEYFNFYKTQT